MQIIHLFIIMTNDAMCQQNHTNGNICKKFFKLLLRKRLPQNEEFQKFILRQPKTAF